MQEDITNKTVVISVRVLRLTLNEVRKAMQKTANRIESNIRKHGAETKEKAATQGKQSIRNLLKSKDSLTSSEVSKDMMKPFNKVAKKYGITYAVTQEKGTDPPRYLLFFKAKDVDLITAAFQEFARTKYHIEEKGSVQESLEKITKASKEKKLAKTVSKEKAVTKAAAKEKAGAVLQDPAKAAKKVLTKELIPERTR